MSWVTIIWSMSAAMSLTLGAIHAVVWLQDRRAWANLTFSITALAVAGIAACEMALMHTDSIERFGAVMRWGHVPLSVMVAGIVGFVSLYFGTGRWWLGCAAVGVRLVSLILNFIFQPNLNYRQISCNTAKKGTREIRVILYAKDGPICTTALADELPIEDILAVEHDIVVAS